MSWPKKVTGKSATVYSPDFNDPSLGIHYSGKSANGVLIDSKGLLNLPKVRSSEVKSLVGSLRQSMGDMASAGQSAIRNVFPIAASSPITGIFLIKPSYLTGDQCLGVSTRFSIAPVDAWNVFLSSNRLHIEKYNYAVGANGYYRPASTLPNNLTYIIGFAFNPAVDTITASINGVVTTGFTAGAVFGYGTAGYFYGGFNDISTLYGYRTLIGAHSLYDVVKDAAWFRSEWVKVAQAIQFKTDWGCKQSIADESTVGNFVGNGSTPFEILSGTWNLGTDIVDGEPVKTITCVNAGTLWLDRKFMGVNNTEAAYGSWRWDLDHTGSVGTSQIGITCSAKSASASHNGYRMTYDGAGTRVLYRHAAAVDTYLFGFASLGQVHVTRRFDNYWYGSVKPFGSWLDFGAAPGTLDATYTTSEGMCFDLTPGDKLRVATVRGELGPTKFLGEFLPYEV
jgi:hypothetical protein